MSGLRLGSLFSGIGGLDLAVERVLGARTIWQAEADPFARSVLAKHWPDVRCYHDVKEIDDAAERPDIICGGFPCQDISNAGKRVGIGGERSGLWSEFARIIRVLRPRFVFVENVAALTIRGLDRVLWDLAAIGFNAEWDVLRAADVGAPHLRARIFILAYAVGANVREQQGRVGGAGWPGEAQPGEHGDSWPLADSCRGGQPESERNLCTGQSHAGGGGATVPNAGSGRCEGQRGPERDGTEARGEDARGYVADGRGSASMGNADGPGFTYIQGRGEIAECRGRAALNSAGWWDAEPDVGRVAHGVPKRVDRLRCLGNAVVWQQAAFALETLMTRARTAQTEAS